MAALNTSSNGPAISASYQKIVNAAPGGSSRTSGQWAVYTVQAPLVSAFQQESGKESVLKVQTTGDGELLDLIDEFSDGRIQFAFVKVKDPNSGLPKSVLIAWCGEGVPERTKGYFTSHLNAVSKILHGYHVQVTARSDRDLTPESIVQKVADASGSKYSGGGAAPASAPPPSVKSKPAMPTKSFGGASSGFSPMGTRSRAAPASPKPTDNDGWGQDAPQVTRSQLEKVDSAYKPTKVDMNQLQSQREPSKYQAPKQASSGDSDVVRGGYQPIGKVDINALRQQAQDQGSKKDDRPTAVKGAYEPVGKVDIADIRRKAQGAPPPSHAPPSSEPSNDEDERPKSLADRSAAFTSSERMTALPKPQVANRFSSSTSNFAGTKAPAPGGFSAKPAAPAAPVGAASRTFADQGGKTPAQQWEEKRRARGLSGAADTQAPGGAPTSPLQSQSSGQWQSAYGGKKWGVQIPTRTGGSGVSAQKTGQDEEIPEQQEAPESPAGGVSSIRDRFKDAPPMGGARESEYDDAPEPPPLNTSSKPNAGARGVPMPGLPQRPQQQDADVPAEEHQDLPPPPPRPVPQDEPEDEDEDPEPRGSPIRIAMPVARSAQPEPMEAPEPLPPRALPTASLEHAISQHQDIDAEPRVADHDPARAAGQGVAASTFGQTEDSRSAGTSGGKEAVAQYDYEKAEDNELELHEGERVTNIDMVDDDWWMGQNSRGESGLFPSNYVELVEDGTSAGGGAQTTFHAEEAAPPSPPAPSHASAGKVATAQYDYEAAEDNELSFPDGAKVTDIEFPDDDWWFGHYGGKSGLFPANYVQLDE
ncbi:hypothetical protein LTR08_001557 [Meristemomyces frigidus]|nr:hypothetical protein LTR08_001557 [Meristemomyces frigidus]